MSLRIIFSITQSAFLIIFTACSFSSSAADVYPDRPIRIVVPFSPGGGGDFVARTLGINLTESMKVSIIVDNRGGGSAVVGTQIVANAAPDGHTLLVVNPNFAVNPAMFDKLPYRTPEDFAPVASFVSYSMALGVRSGLKVSSVKDVIDLAKQKPKTLNFAAGGSTGDLAIGLLEMHSKVQFTQVPYKGTGPATADVAAGNVDFIFTGLSQLAPHVQSGRIRLLATTGLSRSPSAPDIKTLDEQGVKGYEALVWWGFAAPAAVPKKIIMKLNREIAQASKDPALIKRLEILGGNLHVTTPEEFGAFIRSEIKKWGEIVRMTNVKESR